MKSGNVEIEKFEGKKTKKYRGSGGERVISVVCEIKGGLKKGIFFLWAKIVNCWYLDLDSLIT